MNLVLYSDDATEAEWFKNLNPYFKKLKSKLILARGKNIKIIDELVKYDRPDIILLNDGKPVLVIERSSTVPTGHNQLQRVARLVRALELGIPCIYLLKYKAKKGGLYSGMCYLNPRILKSFVKMWEIHNTPIIAVEWPTDSNGQSINDGSEDDDLKLIFENLVDSLFNKQDQIYFNFKKKNQDQYNSSIKTRKAYDHPPSSVKIIKTKEFINLNDKKIITKDQDLLKAKIDSVVYTIDMTEENCHRQDPYTGAQFVYDYAYCRDGKSVEEKNKNLILYFPSIKKSVWLKKNPNTLNNKSSNWYLTANALMFKDDILILR